MKMASYSYQRPLPQQNTTNYVSTYTDAQGNKQKYNAPIIDPHTNTIVDNAYWIGARNPINNPLQMPGITKGNDARAFQEQLQRLGYDVGGVDGIIGNKTNAAFQKYLNDVISHNDTYKTYYGEGGYFNSNNQRPFYGPGGYHSSAPAGFDKAINPYGQFQSNFQSMMGNLDIDKYMPYAQQIFSPQLNKQLAGIDKNRKVSKAYNEDDAIRRGMGRSSTLSELQNIADQQYNDSSGAANEWFSGQTTQLAMQLAQEAANRMMQEQQMSWQQQMANNEMAFKNKQFEADQGWRQKQWDWDMQKYQDALAKASSGRRSSGSSSSSGFANPDDMIAVLQGRQMADEALQRNNGNLAGAFKTLSNYPNISPSNTPEQLMNTIPNIGAYKNAKDHLTESMRKALGMTR